MTAARITRHFVTVGNRRVHYTRAGSGPAVVMLHESPCSAKSLQEAQEIFAASHTAIAFDTPGFGLSDPLPLEQPEIADFADALAETLDALGIDQVAAYGRHTGASIAVEFARRHQQRCAMALTAGYPVYNDTQREDRLTAYLKPLVPSWDGSHLLWLWFRYREQHVFWPWHNHVAASRADTDVPDLDFLQRGVLELLEAGDGYRVAYAAAFRHRGLSALPDLRVPVCFASHPGDSLLRTLALFPAGTWTQEMPRDRVEAAVAERAALGRYHARGAVPPPVACRPLPGRTTTDYVDLGGNQMLVRSVGDISGGAEPVLVLPPIPGSSALVDPLLLALGNAKPVLALDLPGQGESPAPDNFTPDIADWATAALAALDRLGIARVHLYGDQGGAAVAVALAARAGERIASIALGSPPALPSSGRDAFAAAYAPSATPEWDGSHLVRVWHHLRDQELWWPWFDRRRETARHNEPDIDPARLTVRVRECLRQPYLYQAIWQEVLRYPLREQLAQLARPVKLISAEGDLFARFLTDAAAVCADATVMRIGATPEERAAAILA